MERKPTNRCAGFTLIELLVVVTIVAVLATLSVAVSNSVMRRVKETQARVVVHGLVAAIKSYQVEYNQLPKVLPDGNSGTIEDSIVYTEPDNEMIATLLGKNQQFNPRAIQFLDLPLAKNEANGLVNYDEAYGLVDPWSDPASKQWQGYYIVMDYNGTGKLDNPLKRPDSDVTFSSSFLNNQPDKISADVLVYSDGDWSSSPMQRKPITSW
jgi:prepilin-type N-terminal cleavage/methylation domain-containing protein